jgi:hypothetical protein
MRRLGRNPRTPQPRNTFVRYWWPRPLWRWVHEDWKRKPFGWLRVIGVLFGIVVGTTGVLSAFHII